MFSQRKYTKINYLTLFLLEKSQTMNYFIKIILLFLILHKNIINNSIFINIFLNKFSLDNLFI